MVAKAFSSSLCSQLSISSDASNFCRKRTFFATCSSRSNSPFTERHSVKPLRGAGKLEIISNLYTVLSHERKEGTRQHGEDFSELEQEQEHDIATRLPELRQLLSLLHNDERKQEKAHGIGNVFLVGTGPGDPDLLTVKALKLMQTADLVLYDRLVSTDILDLVHAGARLLYVGKTAGYHSRTQDEIHQLLFSFAEAGATVLRRPTVPKNRGWNGVRRNAHSLFRERSLSRFLQVHICASLFWNAFSCGNANACLLLSVILVTIEDEYEEQENVRRVVDESGPSTRTISGPHMTEESTGSVNPWSGRLRDKKQDERGKKKMFEESSGDESFDEEHGLPHLRTPGSKHAEKYVETRKVQVPHYDNKTVCAGGMPYDTPEADIFQLFKECGAIANVLCMKFADT
ncbi:hypothetical protein L7F22_025044 [Adiantum nelumboides]|nr:hypothetical protein [Adiantum nelumboides]